MKHKEISLKDKDFSVLDNLVAEICGEQKSESSNQEQRDNLPNKKEQTTPPTFHDIDKKYQNDPQKDEINNSINWQNNKEKQMAEEFLKKVIEAEIYCNRKKPNPQIISELLKLKKEYPSVYKSLNKEGRVDKVIIRLQELGQESQKIHSQQPNKDDWVLPLIVFSGIALILGFLLFAMRGKKYKSKQQK
ncbi:MAG: hypothetical protein NY202_00115 [Mollicutes bacterium UO1]